jgi:hypothetical protein
LRGEPPRSLYSLEDFPTESITKVVYMISASAPPLSMSNKVMNSI